MLQLHQVLNIDDSHDTSDDKTILLPQTKKKGLRSPCKFKFYIH